MQSKAPRDGDWTDDLRTHLDELLNEYREAIIGSLDGLTESEARASLVPSRTTLLGLVQHATYVEGVWFDQALSGRSYKEIGIASSPARSFTLRSTDTIQSVQDTYRKQIEASRSAMARLPLGTVVSGRGDRPVWSLHLQVLRELAQHAGHADILREQVIAQRGIGST